MESTNQSSLRVSSRKDVCKKKTGEGPVAAAFRTDEAGLCERPLSLWETGESNGSVSIQTLFDGGHDIGEMNGLSVDELAFAICRGGRQQTVAMTEKFAFDCAYRHLLGEICSRMVSLSGIKRGLKRVEALLRAYAKNLGTQVSVAAIRADVLAETQGTFSDSTVKNYMKALKAISVIEELPSWKPQLQTQTAIRTANTRYFSDPSFAAAALGIGPQELLEAPQTFARVFKNLCIRDLRIYTGALDGHLFYYRDKNNLECDAVLHRRDGTYGLIEIKLGGQEAVEHGSMTLRKLADKIDTSRMPKPSFLMVLTAVGHYAYRRQDGVLVVPVGCLKP